MTYETYTLDIDINNPYQIISPNLSHVICNPTDRLLTTLETRRRFSVRPNFINTVHDKEMLDVLDSTPCVASLLQQTSNFPFKRTRIPAHNCKTAW